MSTKERWIIKKPRKIETTVDLVEIIGLNQSKSEVKTGKGMLLGEDI